MRSNYFVPAVLTVLLSLSGCAPQGERICLRDICYSIDVMRTDVQRQQGLMFREGLGQGKGMLFVFDAEYIYPFWMKNMLFAIDILWLDKNKRVVYMETNVPPCRSEACSVYTPSVKAMYVLEIPAGDAAKHRINLGDTLR
jgi:uncharacterized membrane protein (UPF0127 family)